MAVIYLPPTQSVGNALGQGVGDGMSTYMTKELERQTQQAEMQKQLRAMNAVKSAGSREKAMELLSTPGAMPFKTPAQITNMMKFVDELYPQKDLTPHLVEAYNPTGEMVKGYIPSAELPSLNKPENVEKKFGKGTSLTKPQVEPFFSMDPVDGTVKSIGKKNVNARMPGEFTQSELAQMHKQKIEDRQQRTEEYKAASASRSAAAAERANEGLELKKEQAYMHAVADALNIKKTVGADGTFSIDLSGEEPKKVQQYMNAIKDGPALLQQHKSVLKASAAAAEKYKFNEKTEEDKKPEPPKKEEGGIVSRAWKKMTGSSDDAGSKGTAAARKDSTTSQGSPAKRAEVLDAPRDPSKRTKGQVYHTPKGDLLWDGKVWVNPA